MSEHIGVRAARVAFAETRVEIYDELRMGTRTMVTARKTAEILQAVETRKAFDADETDVEQLAADGLVSVGSANMVTQDGTKLSAPAVFLTPAGNRWLADWRSGAIKLPD